MKNNVCVVGGGVVGLSIAAELAKSGADVLLIEKDEVGRGCSYGNAGWLTPCFAMPLPMPGMFFQSVKWLLNPESPLYIKPSLSPDLAKWLVRFLSSMTTAKAVESTQALVHLSKESLQIYKQIHQEFPNRFGYQEKGLLMVAESSAGLKAIENELEYVSRFSVQGQSLSVSDIKKKEPALVSSLVGGAYFPDEAHVEPFLLMAALKERALKYGVKIEEKCEVLEFKVSQNSISSVVTTSGEKTADMFVMATGSYSKDLSAKLNEKLPILGGKGYSMLVSREMSKLQHPVMVIDRKLALTPHEKNIRIAGTLELVDQDYSINNRRAQAVFSGAKKVLGLPQSLDLSKVQDLWRGLRPCTPDGLPVIGFSKNIKNLFYSSGHQMLGLQAGAGTGKLSADLILNKASFMDAKIFSADRF